MSISKGRLEQSALDVASDLDSEYGLGARTTGDWPIKYARALLKAVESKAEVVGFYDYDRITEESAFEDGSSSEPNYIFSSGWKKLIALPLVSSEE